MMREYTITLRTSKGKKVYVDPGEKEGLYLYPSEIRSLKLSDGDILTEEKLEEIRQDYALPRARKRAYAILARADRTEKDLREKLQASCHDSRSLEETLMRMKELGYVDDFRYACDYIRSRRERKSFRMIRQDLLNKGIARETISLAMEEIGDQKDEDMIPAMKKYMRKFSAMDMKDRQKIMAHFGRKGYAPSQIMRVLDMLLEERKQEADYRS